MRHFTIRAVSTTRRIAGASFPDEPILAEDYRQAAICFNRCRAQGIQGSHVDFLICAGALRLDVSIFTADKDFSRFASVLAVRLHQAAAA